MESYLYIIEHMEVADELITLSSNISQLNLDTQVSTEKTDLGGKNLQWEHWSHAAKRLLP